MILCARGFGYAKGCHDRACEKHGHLLRDDVAFLGRDKKMLSFLQGSLQLHGNRRNTGHCQRVQHHGAGIDHRGNPHGNDGKPQRIGAQLVPEIPDACPRRNAAVGNLYGAGQALYRARRQGVNGNQHIRARFFGDGVKHLGTFNSCRAENAGADGGNAAKAQSAEQSLVVRADVARYREHLDRFGADGIGGEMRIPKAGDQHRKRAGKGGFVTAFQDHMAEFFADFGA